MNIFFFTYVLLFQRLQFREFYPSYRVLVKVARSYYPFSMQNRKNYVNRRGNLVEKKDNKIMLKVRNKDEEKDEEKKKRLKEI